MTILVVLTLSAITLWIPLPFAYRLLAERRLQALCRQQKAIALTYDDGPGEQLTLQLAELFKERGVHATFFALGRPAARAPRGRRCELVRDGHEIGSHSVWHHNAWTSNPMSVAQDISEGVKGIRRIDGGNAFRPPYGKITLATLIQTAVMGLRFGWWTIDSRDSWDPRPIDDVIGEIDRKGGGVVLMHDFDQYGDREDHSDYVLRMTKGILDFADESGFRVVTLQRLTG